MHPICAEDILRNLPNVYFHFHKHKFLVILIVSVQNYII